MSKDWFSDWVEASPEELSKEGGAVGESAVFSLWQAQRLNSIIPTANKTNTFFILFPLSIRNIVKCTI
jgi:hypothetical protein